MLGGDAFGLWGVRVDRDYRDGVDSGGSVCGISHAGGGGIDRKFEWFDDAGANHYIDAYQEFKAFPPDDAWRGALELKEK
jgi:hypothetical protein